MSTEKVKKNKALKAEERKAKLSPLTITMLVVLVTYCVVMFILIGWGFLKSLQAFWDDSDNKAFPGVFFWSSSVINRFMYITEAGLDKDLTWFGNYAYIIKNFENTKYLKDELGNIIGQTKIGFGRMLLYTIGYAGGGAFFNTLIQCITAYVCARYAFKFSGVIYGAVIVAMILPVVGSLPSEIAMARALGIYDKIWGMWFMKANFLGMYFLVFHEMFKAIPASYSEAATIDGASDFQILWKIGLPLARNTFMTCFLLNFVTLWNDYQISTVYLPTHPTLAEGIHWMQQGAQIGSTSPIALSGVFVLTIPVLVLFLCFHKRLMGNLTIGGVKG